MAHIAEVEHALRAHGHNLLVVVERMRVFGPRGGNDHGIARLVVEQDGTTYEVDARPSDALALCLRMRAPMYVESPVFIAASIPFNAQHDDFKERELEAFHEYIENIDPEDFKR